MKTIVLSRDGNQSCATYSDFTNLQESPAGFGSNEKDAILDLFRYDNDLTADMLINLSCANNERN